MSYEVDVDKLEKRARAMRINARRVYAPEQRDGMIDAAEAYEAFARAIRAGTVPRIYASEADYQATLRAGVGDTRIDVSPRTPAEWYELRQTHDNKQ